MGASDKPCGDRMRRFPVIPLHSSCLASNKVDYHISPNCKEREFLTEEELKQVISKPQHRKVMHDLNTNTWWLVGVAIVLFFLVFFLIVQIYDQSKEIDRLELSDWKYRALRATLPSNNVNVIWLERNVWQGNDENIRQCQQFVIRSTSGRLARPRITRTPSVIASRWNTKLLCATASDD